MQATWQFLCESSRLTCSNAGTSACRPDPQVVSVSVPFSARTWQNLTKHSIVLAWTLQRYAARDSSAADDSNLSPWNSFVHRRARGLVREAPSHRILCVLPWPPNDSTAAHWQARNRIVSRLRSRRNIWATAPSKPSVPGRDICMCAREYGGMYVSVPANY